MRLTQGWRVRRQAGPRSARRDIAAYVMLHSRDGSIITRECRMAITLRNKNVEEQIRRLARRKGIGPSAVIAEAIERELGHAQDEAERKLRALQQIRSRMRPFSDQEREGFWEELDRINEEPFTQSPARERATRAK